MYGLGRKRQQFSVFLIFRKILQELVASGDLDGDGGLSWEEFEGFGNFEFAANWFG